VQAQQEWLVHLIRPEREPLGPSSFLYLGWRAIGQQPALDDHQDPVGCRLAQREEHVERRRLACAVRAEEGNRFALAQAQGQAINGPHVPVDLADLLEEHHRRAGTAGCPLTHGDSLRILSAPDGRCSHSTIRAVPGGSAVPPGPAMTYVTDCHFGNPKLAGRTR
jgi:hypothetical protein